jgi:CheY-like chemotaxis protein
MDRTEPPGALCVLVADDDQDTADSLAVLLKLWGYHAIVAYNVPAALACRPQVALLDIAMRDLDGCEVARRLRQVPGLERLLLVAVTGHARELDRQRCQEAGFDHHLAKPCEPEQLRALIASASNCGR